MPEYKERCIGTCKTMCSQKEIQFRTKNNLVHSLEMFDDTAKPNPRKMVKEFSRSAAGKALLVPEQLRPPAVLEETVEYLLELYRKEKTDFGIVYSFVVDRLRAVRQDMVVQRLSAEESIGLLEKMIIFYVETEYRCKTTNASFYDWKLHSTQLTDCLSTWCTCLSKELQYSQEILMILLFRNWNDAIKMMSLFPFLTKSNKMHVLRIVSALCASNYVGFFRLISQTALLSWKKSMLDLVYKLRREAIHILSIAYKSREASLPIIFVQKSLLFDSFEHTSTVLSHFFVLKGESISITSFDTSKSDIPELNMLLYKFDHIL